MISTSGDWVSAYHERKRSYDAFAGKLHALLADLLTRRALDVIQIESRVKALASLSEKFSRKGKNYQDPLGEITDIIGLRVITYYQDDVDSVGELLKREFTFHPDQSVDKVAALDPDRFGYASSHYILSLSEDRWKLGEWAAFRDIRFEVQVRTASQHAWAAISHKLDYKTQHEVPRPLRRRLYGLSALFELADAQFAVLRDATENLNASYREQVSDGELDIPVDLDSLEAYLTRPGKAAAGLDRAMRAAGYPVQDVPAARLDRDLGDLLRVLAAYQVETVDGLDRIVTGTEFDKALTEVAEVGNWHEQPPSGGSLADGLTFLMLVWFGADVSLFESVYDSGSTPGFLAARDRVSRLRSRP